MRRHGACDARRQELSGFPGLPGYRRCRCIYSTATRQEPPAIQPPGTADQVAQDALGSVNVRLMRIGLLVMTRAVRVPGCTGARKCRCIVWHSPGGASGRIQLLGSCSDQWPVKGLYGAEGGRAFPHIHPSPANTKCPLAVGLSIHPVEVFI